MKKKKNRILSVSGAALCLFFPVLLAACSQEDALPRPLEVSAEVGSPATRATDAHAGDYDKSEFVAAQPAPGNPQADKQRSPLPVMVVKRLRLRILRRSPGF